MTVHVYSEFVYPRMWKFDIVQLNQDILIESIALGIARQRNHAAEFKMVGSVGIGQE